MLRERVGEDRAFYLSMGGVTALIIFLGFAPSYYLKGVLHAPPPLSALTSVHGAVFTGWVLLFLMQSALVGYGGAKLHRQLGVLGAVLFGGLVAVGLLTAVTAARLGHAPPGAPEPLVFMALPVFGLLGIAVLVILALLQRARSDYHRRLMLAGFFCMTSPAVGRLAIMAGQAEAGTWISLAVPDLLLSVAMGYDRVVHGRFHPAYLWSVGVLLFIDFGVAWGYSSSHWLAFARWLTGG